MSTIKEAATDFLSCRRIAVTGVSRAPKEHGGNIVYTRLKERGYQVFAVNPNTETVEGDRAYPDLTSIPGGVEAVVIATRPEHAEATVREAANLGMTKVWMHRSMGAGSVSPAATTLGRDLGMVVIDGGCPLMFGPTADGGHKVMCALLKLTGKVPRRV
ncbi:MAG: CoA-binding protein [Ornithinibacter sp.]